MVVKSKNTAENTIPDYFMIHKFINENFALNEITFEKQTRYVMDELRNIWPDIPDEEYFKLYSKEELRRCFDLKKSR
jgi:hypothetical protein